MPARTIPLNSSAITTISYDPDTEDLVVTFVNGRSYTHPGVPQDVVDGFMAAPSPGSYYNAVVRGVYG